MQTNQTNQDVGFGSQLIYFKYLPLEKIVLMKLTCLTLLLKTSNNFLNAKIIINYLITHSYSNNYRSSVLDKTIAFIPVTLLFSVDLKVKVLIAS